MYDSADWLPSTNGTPPKVTVERDKISVKMRERKLATLPFNGDLSLKRRRRLLYLLHNEDL